MSSQKKNLLLGVTGSVAAVKTPDLVRRLMDVQFDVHCVLTPAAAQFVTPLALSTLSGHKAWVDMFDEDAHKMPHLQLARQAHVVLIAPASATALGELAHGLARDLVSLIYVTTQAPVYIAPAMHDTMWDHPAVQDNVKILQSRGAQFIGPVSGKLADGNESMGRMAEIGDIVSALSKIK